MNIFPLTLILLSAFNTEKVMQQFLQHLSNGTIQIFPAYATHHMGIFYRVGFSI